MIKTHNSTGLKYLCITKRLDWKSIAVQDHIGRII